jgi:hypothetical protein
MNKMSLGVLLIVGGIAYLGYVYFKKNKPKLSATQQKELAALSANLATSADKIDKPIRYNQPLAQSNPYTPPSFAQVDYTSLTDQQKKDLGTDEIERNIQNADFSNIKIV